MQMDMWRGGAQAQYIREAPQMAIRAALREGTASKKFVALKCCERH